MIKNSLHIIIFSDVSKTSGGKETWLEYFINSIHSDYINIYVYCIAYSDIDFPSNVIFVDSKHKSLPGYLFSSFRAIKKHSAEGDECIYCGINIEAMIFILNKITNINLKHIIWIRGTGIGELKYFWSNKSMRNRIKLYIATLVERYSFAKSKYIIYNGEDTRVTFEQRYGIRENAKTIPNALDLEPSLNTHIDNNLVHSVAYTGRLVNTKGFQYFVEAANRMRETKMTFHAWGENVNQVIKDSDHILYHGAYTRKELPIIASNSLCFVFLNNNTSNAAGGISHSILEALALSRIVIAWDNATHRQLLNSANSILVEEGNIDQLINAIRSLPNLNLNTLTQMMEAAYQTALPYSISEHVKLYKEFVGHT
ncbi:glycosyltransferase [Deinococcus radiopugnans]|uniref:Glycosyltransferase family 4 protein n=1 Tax=Deinococcus radiopugnans ATCC 19172 TaxID=585398 RepID=A0A5C4Y8T0_9DEIO|nr:glycosyltransferase [Deinococcus radiopugnans]MBB6017758.1 glycosyltransferase involved in cell wall biosynthesis [Deinococcus radiopugnans ATCC 19172]TNM71437.1 glycosyltransferase family 4 protein [Deinococcus radiopugnans ATCC 19172]